MRSIHTRGVTVVTIVTLVFTPIWHNHHLSWQLFGRRVEEKTVVCKPHDPCPARKTVVEFEFLSTPDGHVRDRHDHRGRKSVGWWFRG